MKLPFIEYFQFAIKNHKFSLYDKNKKLIQYIKKYSSSDKIHINSHVYAQGRSWYSGLDAGLSALRLEGLVFESALWHRDYRGG